MVMHPLPPGPGCYFLSAQCTFFPAPGKPTRRANRINSVPDSASARDDTCAFLLFSVSDVVRQNLAPLKVCQKKARPAYPPLRPTRANAI